MGFPTWLTWYKKPEYRDIKEYTREINSGRRTLSPNGRGKTAIPSNLTLERILANKTCSPMSQYDFYMYLKYIEYSAENLEFYIWFRNYEKFYNEKNEKRQLDALLLNGGDLSSPSFQELGLDQDPEAAKHTIERISQLIRPTFTCSLNKEGCLEAKSSDALEPGNQTLQGHPEVLGDIVQIFLAPGAIKELNIPPSMREEAIRQLKTSSSPDILRPIADHVYLLLRNCSHRNFVRLGVGNGSFETLCMATGLGMVLAAAGFLVVLLRAFVPGIGSHSRFESFVPFPFWFVGVSLVLSGLRGSCFFLLLFSRRQPLPWERFDDSASMLSNRNGLVRFFSRLMIFDRKFRVQDVHLRHLQDKIVAQSMLGGLIFAGLGVLLFIFLPVWKETARG